MEIEKLQKKLLDAVSAYGKDQNDTNWYTIQGIFNEAIILGKIEGLNEARTFVWGIGFDNDKTASYIKKQIFTRMSYLSEPYDLRNQIRREKEDYQLKAE